MIGSAGVQIWLATAPIDMRQGFDRLAARVREQLQRNPLGGHLFVYRNRSGERMTILWRDGTGLVLYYKRLERGTFRFPAAGEAAAVTIDSTQLLALLAGSEIVARHSA